MRFLLIGIFLVLGVSCAGLDKYSKYPIERNSRKMPTVIDKLESCTAKYIRDLGVNPESSYKICNSIYRGK